MNVSVKRDHGMLKVDINGKLYAPLSFKSFRPNPQNVSEFYKAGVRLFSVLSSGIICALGVPYSRFGESWTGENEYDFSAIDRQMDMFIENAPEGYFAPMIQIDTRPWYLEAHPDAPNSFKHISWAAYDEEWKRAAAEYLKAAIRHCEEKYGERIYGYFILGGMTTEWLAHPDKEASHPLKEAGFRAFMNDENAKLPSLDELQRTGNVFLEDDEDNVLAARRFHAEGVADLVLYFAAEAQSVIKHKKLLGCYYGYLLHLAGTLTFDAGHLGYEKVFYSPDIDMISSPSCYRFRAWNDPSAFMVTQKTLDKHGKLYFLEFDHITHVAPTMINEPCVDASGNASLPHIPGANSKCKDATESLNLMWRDFVLCYANGAALWWFDMFDGWFRSEEMMGAIEKMISLHSTLGAKDKQSISRIAVYAEGESMYHVRKSSKLSSLSLSAIRRALAEIGAPYDIYSISDIGDCDWEQYKLVILLDSYDIPTARMEKLRTLQENGVTVVWMYAPDYARDGANSVGQISFATGINVEQSEISHGGIMLDGKVTESPVPAPYFSVNDENAVPYAYFEDGTVAVAATKDKSSVYAATPLVPSALLRRIAAEKGIFIYSNDPLVYTYVNSDAIGVFNATDKDAVLNVPEDGVYVDMVTDEEFISEDGILTLPWRALRAYLLVRRGISIA